MEVTSPEEIILTAGGSQLKINASGVFITTAGEFKVKAAEHNLLGAGKVNVIIPKINPAPLCKDCLSEAAESGLTYVLR